MGISYDFVVPTAKEYVKALKKIKKSINDNQKKMLERHYRVYNRTISYSDLASAAGSDDYQVANDEYGKLGQMLGDSLNMGYLESVAHPGEPFYGSAIGCGNPYKSEDQNYQLVMHRELVEAISKLKWFK